MKIVALETIRPTVQPNLCFVRLHTDEGPIGLGESFYGAAAVETYLHEEVVPRLVGMVDAAPGAVEAALRPYVGYQGGGVEIRGNGAVDLALWDLLGKSTGLPLVDLLGGPCRESIKTYNTCAGPRYVSGPGEQHSANWGLAKVGEDAGTYEDLQAFLARPGELARELAAEGITGMKIWPFDRYAERSGGTEIETRELDEGLRIVAAIREAVGTAMDVMIELHGLWLPGPATKICRALAGYEPAWVEDPVRVDLGEALAQVRRESGVPVAAGETCTGQRGVLTLLRQQTLDVAIVDIGWSGGLSEARKIASLAEAFGVPLAPHDCTGPVGLAAGTHLACAQPNGLVQETVRAALYGWYPLLVTGLPEISNGRMYPHRAPGHGISMREDLLHEAGSIVRISRS